MFVKSLAIIFTITVVVGLYKPWIVFWWSDFSNRKKVLMYYGVPALLFWIIYSVLKLMQN